MGTPACLRIEEDHMEINPASSIQSVARASTPPVAAPTTQTPRYQAAFDHATALDRELAEAPDVRTDLVEKAESLTSLSSYPPPEILVRVARLLAINMAPEVLLDSPGAEPAM